MGDETKPETTFNKLTSRRTLLAGTAGAAAALSVAYVLGDRYAFDQADSDTATVQSPAPPSTPSVDFSSDTTRLGHLLRRTGFGVTREEFDRYLTMGVEATTDELLNYAAIADDEAIELVSRIDLEGQNPGSAVAWWLARIANTKRPLQEKMTFFWHGLLTSQISVVRDPVAMVAQNEFLRANALGVFPDILKGISQDAAMMVYLDVSGSLRASPNENYARELMELFSLGVGNFSEDDVREAARAFTGWRVPRRRSDNGRPTLLEPIFQSRQYDSGPKTVLGETGAFGPDEIVDLIVRQPASAAFITGKLFSYFVYPSPDEATQAPFIDVYETSGRSIGATVEAMLRSEVFYSDRAYRALVKTPIEYAVGAVKALGQQTTVAQALVAGNRRRGGGALGQMGQVPFEPPNVAGWPGGASWLNSSTLFARLNFLNTLTAGGSRPTGNRPTDRRAQTPPQPVLTDLGTAEQALSHFLPLLLDDNLSDEARATLLSIADADAELNSEQLRDLVYLILAAPETHLA